MPSSLQTPTNPSHPFLKKNLIPAYKTNFGNFPPPPPPPPPPGLSHGNIHFPSQKALKSKTTPVFLTDDGEDPGLLFPVSNSILLGGKI